jgi:hypothetical protein
VFEEIGDCPDCLRWQLVLSVYRFGGLLTHVASGDAEKAIEAAVRMLGEDLPPQES